jgi:hypothetical protein
MPYISIYPPSYHYIKGRACPHCLWVEDDDLMYNKLLHYRINKYNKVDHRFKKKFMEFPKEENFIGVTIFDNHKKFKNSFLCVNGVKNSNGKINHDYHNISSVLSGSEKFIKYVNEKYKINSFKIIINNKNDKQKHNCKEHPHSWILISEETKYVIDFFREIDDETREESIKLIRPPGGWKYDTDIYLNNNECIDLFLQTDETIIGCLFKLINNKLCNHKYLLNVDDIDFYICINYTFGHKLTGIISIPTSQIVKNFEK